MILTDNTELPAEVVGTDPKTDLAVLRVKSPKPLPAVAWGDSAKSRVGDWVIAVGNPFGLGGSVTAGIISARARDINVGPYENFLQTDAAINPGNSGGPLVNLRGEVVGINTAIATRSGSSAGVGFAIPSNLARSVMDDLIRDGKVERGWLGVFIQDLTPGLAASFRYDGRTGVLIGDVTEGGPAEKAGLRAGDIIVRFNGDTVRSSVDLRNTVAETAPGTKVKVNVFRQGKRLEIDVQLGLMESDVSSDGREPSAPDGLGLTVRSLDAELAGRLGFEETQRGALITQVEPGSIAAREGLMPGQVIVNLNGRPVTDVESFRKAMTTTAIQEGVRLQILSDGMRRFVFLRSDESE